MDVTTVASEPSSDGRQTQRRLSAVACRVLDVVLAVVLIIVLLPVMLAIALAIRLDSPGPVLFRQRRLGRELRPFTINKFRTMYSGADHSEHRSFVQQLIGGSANPQHHRYGPMFKLTADPRVTRVGVLLRQTSLDELPQLFNVLLGHMSLVGPRPCLDYEVERYPAEAFERFSVLPGLTGLWQVSGRCQLTFEEMIALDVKYVRTRTPWLYLRIILQTVPTVLFRRGAA